MVIRPVQVTGKYKTKVPVAAFDWVLFIVNDILEIWGNRRALGGELHDNTLFLVKMEIPVLVPC